MARRARSQTKLPIESYDHRDKERLNNPPVGLVTPETDRDSGSKSYAYDPHLDPQLQWAGKAEHTSFEMPSMSMHVHAYRGTVSLPFEMGEHGRVAVKIVDDRGIESLRIVLI